MPRDSVRLNETSLYRVGVSLLDADRVHLHCEVCGIGWSPNLGAEGRLPHRWWRCPRGCNADLYVTAPRHGVAGVERRPA